MDGWTDGWTDIGTLRGPRGPKKPQWGKVEKMQSMWLCILLCKEFKDTFENAQRRKVKQMHVLIQILWRVIWKDKVWNDILAKMIMMITTLITKQTITFWNRSVGIHSAHHHDHRNHHHHDHRHHYNSRPASSSSWPGHHCWLNCRKISKKSSNSVQRFEITYRVPASAR